MSDIGTATTGLLERVAAFAERRHEVLATNVARIDVPGYERHDLDVEGFRAALKQAVAGNRASRDPAAVPASRSNRDPFHAELFQPKPDSTRNVRFHDAAVRSVETEMTELVKNSMLHSFAVEVMNAQYATLQAIVSERP